MGTPFRSSQPKARLEDVGDDVSMFVVDDVFGRSHTIWSSDSTLGCANQGVHCRFGRCVPLRSTILGLWLRRCRREPLFREVEVAFSASSEVGS